MPTVDECLQHESNSFINSSHCTPCYWLPRGLHRQPLPVSSACTKNTPSFFLRLHCNPATMSSGQVLKAEKDFTKEADTTIPEAEKLGSVCLKCMLWKRN